MSAVPMDFVDGCWPAVRFRDQARWLTFVASAWSASPRSGRTGPSLVTGHKRMESSASRFELKWASQECDRAAPFHVVPPLTQVVRQRRLTDPGSCGTSGRATIAPTSRGVRPSRCVYRASSVMWPMRTRAQRRRSRRPHGFEPGSAFWRWGMTHGKEARRLG